MGYETGDLLEAGGSMFLLLHTYLMYFFCLFIILYTKGAFALCIKYVSVLPHPNHKDFRYYKHLRRYYDDFIMLKLMQVTQNEAGFLIINMF